MDDFRKVVSAEKCKDGLLIEFADELCAFYPTSLLRDIASQAIIIAPVEHELDDPGVV